MNFSKFCAFVFTVCIIYKCEGHGRLMDPPSRSSMWRFGFGTLPNYNDNELFCGGIDVQWKKNGGKCGLCGDPYQMPQPRENEAGGKYGKGIIVKWYEKGSIIHATVDLTANHRGYFEFKLCPHNNPKTVANEECFNKYPLPIAETSEYKFYVPLDYVGDIHVALKLPENLTCTQCVFRWQYRGENNWGTCENGTQRVGCGPQETFRACADVAILDELPSTIPWIKVTAPPSKNSRSTTVPSIGGKNSRSTTVPSIGGKNSRSTTVPSVGGKHIKPKCQAVGVMRSVPGISTWCEQNCKMGHCPKELCAC